MSTILAAAAAIAFHPEIVLTDVGFRRAEDCSPELRFRDSGQAVSLQIVCTDVPYAGGKLGTDYAATEAPEPVADYVMDSISPRRVTTAQATTARASSLARSTAGAGSISTAFTASTETTVTHVWDDPTTEQPAPVPLPASGGLLVAGIIALIAGSRRKSK